jgi:Na+-translocating ferredoxin:NAD+ oxidoreductase RnfE subunit
MLMLSAFELVLWVLAASMAAVISFCLKWMVEHRNRPGSLMVPFVVFILVMMLSMVVSAVVYLTSPTLGLLIDLVVANMFVMGLGALPFPRRAPPSGQ